MGDRHPIRIVDKKGFIKVQCSDGIAAKVKAGEYKEKVEELWKDMASRLLRLRWPPCLRLLCC